MQLIILQLFQTFRYSYIHLTLRIGNISPMIECTRRHFTVTTRHKQPADETEQVRAK